jgi:hypothetical protein
MALRFPATSDASLRLPKAGEPPHGLHQFPQYRGVSNFNVVLFCQQAGLSLEGMLVAAGRFARVSSSRRFRISSKGLAYAFLVTLPFSIVLVPAGAFYVLYVVGCLHNRGEKGRNIQVKHAVSDHRDGLFDAGRGCIRQGQAGLCCSSTDRHRTICRFRKLQSRTMTPF